MNVVLQTLHVTPVHNVIAYMNCLALATTRQFNNIISVYPRNVLLAFPLGLRYDVCTTLKTHHYSVSGSINREPPGRPEMSSPAVKTPVHRSKAHNPEAGRSNRPPATDKNAVIYGVFCLLVHFAFLTRRLWVQLLFCPGSHVSWSTQALHSCG